MTTATIRKSEANKPQRVPVSGNRDILTVQGKDPDYSYRFVLDVDENGSRIQKFLRGGYELAQAKEVVIGDDAVYRSKNSGSIVRTPSGDGKRYQYLMRIRKDWYDEDRAAAQSSIDETEEALRKNLASADTATGQYGSVKIKN